MPPLAINKQTGEVRYLGPSGQWEPAKIAENPQTKERLAFDGEGWKPLPKPDLGVMGYIDAATRNIADVVTFGLADRAGAYVNPIINRALGLDTPDETYDQSLARERAQTADAPAAIKIPSQIAGGVAQAVLAGPAVAAGAARAGLTALPKAAQFAGLGAAEGAAQAAGHGENIATGALVGGAVGAAAPAVASGVAGLYNRIKGAFSPKANVAADLGRAIARDETTPEALAAGARQLAEERPGVATLADAGGENVRGLVERVAQTPGAGRTQVVPALMDRQKEQAARVTYDLRALTGTSRSAYKAVAETIADRAKAASPIYENTYQAGDREIWSPQLERLAGSPTVANAMRGAVRIWQDNAIADGFGALKPRAMVQGGQLKFQAGGVPAFPNIQFWDYTKRVIDDQARKAFKSGANAKGRTLSRLAEQLRTELDKAVPEYAAAREAWAGPSAYLEAIEYGKSAFARGVDSAEFAAEFAGKSAAEQDGIRIGLINSLVAAVKNDPSKLGDMTKYLRSPAMREKIAAIMPTPEAAQSWTSRLDFEVGVSELTGKALGNSATARRLAERADAEGIVGDLVIDALSGVGSVSMLRRVLTAGPKWLRDTIRSRADKELGDLLTNPKRLNDLDEVLKRIAVQPKPASGQTVGAATSAVVPMAINP